MSHTVYYKVQPDSNAGVLIADADAAANAHTNASQRFFRKFGGAGKFVYVTDDNRVVGFGQPAGTKLADFMAENNLTAERGWKKQPDRYRDYVTVKVGTASPEMLKAWRARPDAPSSYDLLDALLGGKPPMLLETFGGRLFTRRAALIRPKDHPPIIGIPYKTYKEKNLPLCPGLVLMDQLEAMGIVEAAGDEDD